jgi:hypothetical protein
MSANTIECKLCGIKGVHACLGSKQKPLTEQQKADFYKSINAAAKRIKESEGKRK